MNPLSHETHLVFMAVCYNAYDILDGHLYVYGNLPLKIRQQLVNAKFICSDAEIAKQYPGANYDGTNFCALTDEGFAYFKAHYGAFAEIQ